MLPQGLVTYALIADKFIKIGVTDCIGRRFTQFTTSCPFPVEFIGYWEGDVESEMHLKFAGFHHCYEWFHIDALETIEQSDGYIKYTPEDIAPKERILDPITYLKTTDENKQIIYNLSGKAREMLLYVLLNMNYKSLSIRIDRVACMDILGIDSETQYREILDELIYKAEYLFNTGSWYSSFGVRGNLFTLGEATFKYMWGRGVTSNP